MRPLIGITPIYDYEKRVSSIKFGYQEGIIRAGGTPVIIPFTLEKEVLEDIFNKLDGIVLSGGPDIDPKFFNEDTYTQTGEISPIRDEQEIYLAKMSIIYNKPLLGICRGCQILNIAGGGNIYQDIYSQTPASLKHSQDAPKWYPSHSIRLIQGSLHNKIYSAKELRVNSFHHQAVRDLGDGFIAAATASDGIIEAIENRDCNFCIGVQYHPELMWENDAIFLKLFKELVKAANCNN